MVFEFCCCLGYGDLVGFSIVCCFGEFGDLVSVVVGCYRGRVGFD